MIQGFDNLCPTNNMPELHNTEYQQFNPGAKLLVCTDLIQSTCVCEHFGLTVEKLETEMQPLSNGVEHLSKGF